MIAGRRLSSNKNIDCAVKDAPHNRGANEMKSSRNMYHFCVALATFSIALLMGCESPGRGPSAVPEGPDLRTRTNYSPGDKVLIDFTDNPGVPSVWQQVIREDGTITLPLNQTLVAAGRTKGELEQAIRDLYVPRILKRLTVNVRAEQRTYFVSGEVKTPGQREHTGLMTAMKAIAASGDFTDFANKSDIKVIRSNGEVIKMDGKQALRDPSKDVPVYPGDRVHVDRRLF
jgi:protein involved in polysaccharide export with SLBB domain